MVSILLNVTFIRHLVRKFVSDTKETKIMSGNKETHYSVLNLKEDCTAKEIKEAFITLSKKYHPDCNNDKRSHSMFLKINEAYSVLNKSYSRQQYDQLLSNQDRVYHHYYDNVYTTRNDPSFWASRAKGAGFAREPYYGIKGVKKVSNAVIVIVCLAAAAIGLGLEVVAMSKSFTFDRERLRHDSARNQILLEFARNQAADNGNDIQIKNFQEDRLRGGNIREVTEEYQRRLTGEQITSKEKDIK